MIITGKFLPRRTFLRGMGATLALPFLDSMVPAFGSRALACRSGHQAARRRLRPERHPDGKMDARVGGRRLRPDADPRAARAVSQSPDDRHRTGEQAGVSGDRRRHRRSRPGRVDVSDRRASEEDRRTGHSRRRLDGSARGARARARIRSSPRSSCVSIPTSSLAPAKPATAARTRTRCRGGIRRRRCRWRTSRARCSSACSATATTRPARRGSRAFARTAACSTRCSARSSRLKRDVGSDDRGKLAQYLDAIRDIERRIQKAEQQSDIELPLVERPTGGIPATFKEHARMMFDMQVLAFQCDLTRVITFLMSREVSPRTYTEIGISDPHHGLSHHQNNPAQMEKLAKINRFHVEQLAYFLEKLEATPDGDGHVARSGDAALRLRHQQQQPAHARQPADPRGRRPGGSSPGPASPLRQGHAADESAAVPALQGRRADRQPGRQHGAHRPRGRRLTGSNWRRNARAIFRGRPPVDSRIMAA